jgi:hypothetical protein
VTLGASSRGLSSGPGLSRPSTPRRLNDVSDIATAGGNVLGKQCFPSWPLGSKNFDALAHMEGRDEPGHDASGRDNNEVPKDASLSCFT